MPRTIASPAKRPWTILALLSLEAVLEAQEPGPTARQFCVPEPPPCRRLDCGCLEGGLQVALDAAGGSVRELARFDPGEPVETTLALVTEDPNVQGWSFGIRHDPRFLTLESVTLEGSDARRLAPCAFWQFG